MPASAGPDNSDPAIAAAFLATDTETTGAEPGCADGGACPTRAEPRWRRGTGDAQAGLAERVRSWFADPRTGPGTCGRRSRRPGTGR